MRTTSLAIFPLLLALTPLSLPADWAGFRGDGTSVAADQKTPVKWTADADKSENIAWKAPLPGNGVACPIVVGDRVFVTAASGGKNDRLHVICLDKATGKKLWERQFWATGRTLCHPSSSVAANTPATDGQRIFAFFSSNDLVCLDLDGNLQWYRGLTVDYPLAGNDIGMSSSVVVADGVVIVQSEAQGDSFAAGFDANTGETKWRIDRDKSAHWASPVVAAGKTAGESVVLLTNGKGVSAHDPSDGQQIWLNAKPCDGISSCVYVGDVAYVPGDGLRALRFTGSSSPELLWTQNKLNAGAASPIVHDGKVYVINRAGVLNAADAATGNPLWQLRLKGQFWATPVIADGKLYATAKDGLIQVVDLTKEKGEVLAENPLNEEVMATPAIADGAIFVRSNQHVWKVGK